MERNEEKMKINLESSIDQIFALSPIELRAPIKLGVLDQYFFIQMWFFWYLYWREINCVNFKFRKLDFTQNLIGFL